MEIGDKKESFSESSLENDVKSVYRDEPYLDLSIW